MMRGPRIPKSFTITYALIALNVLVYVYTSYLSGNAFMTSNDVLGKLGQDNYLVLQNSAYYQLLTSMFVHVSLDHIFGNMLFLLIFGLRAEEMFDTTEYVGIYLLSGLAGNLLSLVPTILFPSFDMVSAGASGAILGMFGAVVIYSRRAVGQSILTALLFAFFLFFISSASPGVNVFAHAGGLTVGLLMGYALGATRKTGATYRFKYTY
jgi:rhomboid protease GluP